MFSVLEQYNSSLTIEELEEATNNAVKLFHQIWKHESKTIDSKQIILSITQTLNMNLTENDLSDCKTFFENSVLDNPPELVPEILEALPKLTEKYQLGIISDTQFSPGSVLRHLLDTADVLKYFSAFSFSNEIGVSKPHPNMYQHIMNTLKCEASEMVHIGDLERTDIAGANNLGIQSILYFGANKEDQLSESATAKTDSWLEILKIIGQMDSVK